MILLQILPLPIYLHLYTLERLFGARTQITSESLSVYLHLYTSERHFFGIYLHLYTSEWLFGAPTQISKLLVNLFPFICTFILVEKSVTRSFYRFPLLFFLFRFSGCERMERTMNSPPFPFPLVSFLMDQSIPVDPFFLDLGTPSTTTSHIGIRAEMPWPSSWPSPCHRCLP